MEINKRLIFDEFRLVQRYCDLAACAYVSSLLAQTSKTKSCSIIQMMFSAHSVPVYIPVKVWAARFRNHVLVLSSYKL